MERENDHNYAASRLDENEEGNFEFVLAVLVRDPFRPILNEIRSNNSTDHDYLSISSSSTIRLIEDDERSVSTVTTVGATSSSSSISSSSSSSSSAADTSTNTEIVSVGSNDNVEGIMEVLHGVDVTNDSDIEVDVEFTENINSPEMSNEEISNPLSPPKKRKRLLETSKTNIQAKENLNKTQTMDDDSEGVMCSICLDAWEISGDHRLASLKCGHLFGNSCIRRWLKESTQQTGGRACPQCKTKAHPREIRYLYANRVRVLDRTEERRLANDLKNEQTRSERLEMEASSLKVKLREMSAKLGILEADHKRLQRLYRNDVSYSIEVSESNSNMVNKTYKLCLQYNINITNEAGCRVMAYAQQELKLLVSQKGGPCSFPGYGVRFIDVETFRPTTYLPTCAKLLRDISLNNDERMLAYTSLEIRAKLFDLRNNQIAATFMPSDKPLWSCYQHENFIYFGGPQGNVFSYDKRFPGTIVSEYTLKNDISPVINVVAIPHSSKFPNGGFVVCTLNSLWFYEYKDERAIPQRLDIEGPFTYMEFNAVKGTLLITTRHGYSCPYGRHFIGNLDKIEGNVFFNVKTTFFGSKTAPVMIRSTQIPVESNILVGAYLLDTEMLTIFDVNQERRVHSLPVQDVIYDVCPIYSKDNTYLAALAETKCRIYKLNVND